MDAASSAEWTIFSSSNNCKNVSDIAMYNTTAQLIGTPIDFYAWNTSVFGPYGLTSQLSISLVYTETGGTFDPQISLTDNCGNVHAMPSVAPAIVYSNQFKQIDYREDYTQYLSSNTFQGNVNVTLRPDIVSKGFGKATMEVKCVLVSFTAYAGGTGSCQPSSSPIPSATPTYSVTPSVSPSPSPALNPSVSPSRTPSPSFGSSSPPSPVPSASSSIGSSSTPSPVSSPSNGTRTPDKPSSKAGGGNTGIIIGVVVGAVVGLVLISALAFLLITKRKKNRKDEEDKEINNSNAIGMKTATSDIPQNDSSEPKSHYQQFNTDSRSSSTSANVDRGASKRNVVQTLSSEVYIDDIKLKGLLGKGKFGEVYEGLWHGTTAVACKKLKKDDKEEFENEIMLLMKLNHPNVVRCLGIYVHPTSGEIFMILELLRLGSLTNFLRNPESQKRLSIADLVEMCVHAASGMVFLEQKNIVHRDLGARNLLVTETDGRYVVKISDFGLSRQVEENDAIYSSKEGVFPVKWSPPEVINFRQFTSKVWILVGLSLTKQSDVWSFGITMWEIFELGKIPYPTLTNDEAVAQVMKGYRLPCPSTCPDPVYKLMLRCWAANPAERPDFKSVHEELQKVLSGLKGENDEFQYVSEDADRNYNYNTVNNTKNETYNNTPQNGMYNNVK